jgi:hypothetical protein
MPKIEGVAHFPFNCAEALGHGTAARHLLRKN